MKEPAEFDHVRFPEAVETIAAEAPAPAFVIDLDGLRRNLAILASVKERASCRILLAQKGFSAFQTYSIIAEYLDGACASSPHEARLAREYLNKEVHAYAPAWRETEVTEMLPMIDHLLFNSVGQLRRFGHLANAARRQIDLGLRVNPEHREGSVDLYDPCASGSRLGVLAEELEAGDLEPISGLHFHTLCEADAGALVRTLAAFEARFGQYLPALAWVNFGGGHHITRAGYDRDLLVTTIANFRQKHGVEVYLEPGEAVALNAGVLVCSVLDIVHPEDPVAILDISATAHMPDVLEMPYRPTLLGGGQAREKPHTYRLGGLTCLAGDVIGTYSFDRPLKIGDRLVFGDMGHYTMVKTTTFNGVPLPSICHYSEAEGLQVRRVFGYQDFKSRLG
ncbi:MAG: carboxynorspermidine decarboxylase [Puniceicoccaceae bacterium]